MIAAITRRDILAHPLSTIRCFGWRFFLGAVAPWQNRPFLAQLRQAGFLGAQPSSVPRTLGRCIDLELRAKRVYKALVRTYGNEELVGPFLAGLVEQEQRHADLLEIARATAMQSGWKASLFEPWQDCLADLERQMDAAEAAVAEVDSVAAAVRLVIQLESSERNQVFGTALAATDAAFVKRLRPFRNATEARMSYLVERLSELSPRLTVSVEERRARAPKVRTKAVPV